jgi:hypothetical protein
MQSEKHIGLTDEEVKANREEFGNNSSGLEPKNRLWTALFIIRFLKQCDIKIIYFQ